MWQPDKKLSDNFLSSSPTTDGQGLRSYELTNHLGNVLATINDKGNVVSAQDYTPFGMSLIGRTTNTEGYRFGFNGKEYDVAFKTIDFGERGYRANLGRFTSVDPLQTRAPGLTPYRFGFNNPMRYNDPDGGYESDGHYWTIYMIGLMIGLKPDDARRIAYNAEKWDTKIHGEVAVAQYTWASPRHQNPTHALSNGTASIEQLFTWARFLSADNEDEEGRQLHRFGDSHAHSHMNGDGRMYGKINKFFQFLHINFTIEHNYAEETDGQTGTRPDQIYERPPLFLKYVNNVAKMMASKYNKDLDCFDINKFKELTEYAVANKISLLGIMNYEVAKMQGENMFFVHKTLVPNIFEPFLKTKAAYKTQVENTIKYLDSKGVKFTTKEVTRSQGFGRKQILGTRFYLK